MMCWSWIESSREREALTISCPGPGIASLRRCTAGPGQKIAKTTPCKVEWTPACRTPAALRPGQSGPWPPLLRCNRLEGDTARLTGLTVRPHHDLDILLEHGEHFHQAFG